MDLTRLGQLGKEGVLALLCDSTNVERPGHTCSERAVGASFDELFKGCKERIIVTTFASNVDRIQQIVNVAASYGRKVAVTGRSMENSMRVATELGYTDIPKGVMVDINHIKSLPKDKVCIITTGSQGEAMSALFRIAFSTHKQVEIQAGDRVIISASAVPGNESSVNNIINELYRKRPRWSARTLHPPRLRPRLPGRAEDHPRPGSAQVLYPCPRRAAPPPDPRQSGPGDGHPAGEHHHRRCGPGD